MDRDALALYPMRPVDEVRAVTADEMREVDRLAVQDAKLDLLQMMENAGQALARVARDYLPPGPEEGGSAESSIVAVVGEGNNGGGALAAARHLRNWGYDPQIILSSSPKNLGEAGTHQHHTLHKDGVRALWPGASGFDDQFPKLLEKATLVIDGLVGYGLSGPLRGDAALLVEAVLDRAPPVVVSLDVPSGFDATSGAVFSSGIVATVTLTLALPKTGLLRSDAAAAIGDLLLADIGIPHYIYERLDIDAPAELFAAGGVVRLLTD